MGSTFLVNFILLSSKNFMSSKRILCHQRLSKAMDLLTRKLFFFFSTRGIHFWCRKVFEGVQNHVLNLVQRNTSNMHQKCAFEQFKMNQKCNLTRDSPSFSPKSQFWCIFLSEINNHVLNYTFGAF